MSSALPTSYYYVLLALIILFFALIRLRLRDMPLERDEGEYAYAGQLLLQGIPPYTLAYNMKLPGTYVAYAVIMAIFGQTASGIHIGLMVVSATTTALVFFLTKRLFNAPAGVIAAASYELLVTHPVIMGLAAHATHFVVLVAVGGCLLLLIAMESRRIATLFWSGFLFGLAFVMKQPGIFFAVFGIVYLIRSQRKQQTAWSVLARRLAAFAGAVVLPFALTCLWLWRAGAFDRFWFWTFTYARSYATAVNLRDAPGAFFDHALLVINPVAPIWIIGAIGLILTYWKRKDSDSVFFTTAFLVCSFLAVCPGFYFRVHYFILILPAVSLLVGAAVSAVEQRFSEPSGMKYLVPVAVFLIAFGYVIFQQREFFFEMDPIAAARWRYAPNPFVEGPQIADYLKAHTSASDTVAVIGSEPEIYFYAQRHSATGYIYTYPLVEDQPYALTMQKQMIAEVERSQPKYLVYVNVPLSWLRHSGSPQLLFDWAQKYLTGRYVLAGIVDILPESQYQWGEAAKTYRPVSPNTIQVFRRISP